ncbi:MAG: Stp1/IreP family PP2C-type Ser/Thr phosphatase [Aggregatilineales bacterium]
MMANSEKNLSQNIGLAIDKGNRRENNEDSAAAVDMNVASGDALQSVGIYAIADGMGGHREGEVASRMAIQTAVQEVINGIASANGELDDSYTEWLTKALETANRVVRGDRPKPERMGTTLVVAVVVNDKAYIANVGDSRAYLIIKDDIYQITQDQSVVQMLVSAGAITKEEAENHPYKHMLSQAIGIDTSIKVDTFNTEITSDAFLLLCSDGLTNELEDSEILTIISDAKSPQIACDLLVDAAKTAGGKDNISAVLIQLKRNTPEA